MRDWIDLNLEVLTPAFISGADQKEVEFRAASVRGLLRWWWRATVGHDCEVPELAQREARLFGSASEGLKSPLTISVNAEFIKRMDLASRLPNSGFSSEWRRGNARGRADVLPYIAYGPVRLLKKEEKFEDGRPRDPAFKGPDGKAPKDPVLVRPAMAAGDAFGVRLAWRTATLTMTQENELVCAACAWVTLGGIGSRSRKGWGSLEGSIRLASTSQLHDRAAAEWKKCRDTLLTDGSPFDSNAVPDFPQVAFRRIWSDSQTFDRWENALGSIGKRYKDIRPRGEARWIAGDASPRRASSLLLTLIREPDRKLRGLLCLLPCRKDQSELGEASLQEFINQFDRLRGFSRRRFPFAP